MVGVASLFRCGQEPAAEPERTEGRLHFTDATSSSGLDARTVSGVDPSTQILEVKGGGLALIDYDGDGDRDVFVPNGATLGNPHEGPGAMLFRNEGGMRFTDVTEASGITHRGWSFGTAVGDVDGDGHQDIFIACFGPDVLLRNRGDGTFEDITARSGLGDPGWATSAAFGDLDADGDLDLFVARYIEFDPANPPPNSMFKGVEVLNGPRGLVPLVDLAYENLGDGTFRRIKEAGALGAMAPSYGLNVLLVDFDGDARIDVLVGNDSAGNHVYRNATTEDSGLSFEEIGFASGLATNVNGYEQATMGIAVTDLNDDGHPDIFSSNFSSDMNTMHVSLGDFTYQDATRQYGFGVSSRPFLGWASGFFDFDHDGDEDLLVFNGHVYPQATMALMDSDYAQVPLFMESVGGRFELVAPAGVMAEPRRDRSAVFDDLDGDGDIDVLVAELNGPVRVLRNDGAMGHWATVELADERPGIANSSGIGSALTFKAGDWTARRWVLGGGPFQSTWSPVVHVGLPGEPGAVFVEVTWPDGVTTAMELETNRHSRIRRTPDGIEVE